ncbi:MAG: CDP-alcohol phosphatidyltransferase family protein [Desulfomonile sp.]|jgi:phosphatidylglycerophosphate synthase|nr:CDP-alcohol phosphatidyltransferase family protein [Deltaproteobacteria bacterium]
MKKVPEEGSGSFSAKVPADFLNYFGKDRFLQYWFREKRTRLIAAVFPRFERLGLVPDTVSYIGISFLAGVILYFVRDPKIAVFFLAGHIICDGLDGAFARHTGKASQSGAFTDLVCDQLGMVVVGLMAIFHHMVSPLLGTVYIALYLIVVVFGVIINVMGLGTRVTITSKYFLYSVYGIWAGWEINWFPWMMYFFSVIMTIEVVIGYLRLKRGIRKKFDSEVRFTEGDPYSGRLNYALNVAVPVIVLVAILVCANLIPIRSIFLSPKVKVSWIEGPQIVHENENSEILGLGVQDMKILVLLRLEDGSLELRRFSTLEGDGIESFVVPEHVTPAISTFPVYENILLIADSSTGLLIGMDIEASLVAKRAVTVLTLPLGYLRVTAMAVADWKQKKVWLAANYLYTRRTYVVDPDKALKKGFILGGVVASYTNGAFPSGMTVVENDVLEFNKSPFNALIFQAPLKRMLAGKNLIDAATVSFLPPHPDSIGPVKAGEDLIMLSPAGRLYKLPIKSYSRRPRISS